MRIKVGCEFVFQAASATPLVAQVLPRRDGPHRLLFERQALTPVVPAHEYLDLFGNRCWRLTVPKGEFSLRYDATVELVPLAGPVVPDAKQALVDQLPDETLVFTLPSRYVQSDLLANAAWELFGGSPLGWARVQAICDWIHQRIEFRTASTTPQTTVLDVFLVRYGVCRDFAHLGVAMCRALNIPARYVFGYLPDVGVEPPDVPMDFHSWFEAYVGDRWYTFDARHNEPRIGRIPIGRGRDAADVALLTQYGSAQLTTMTVWSDEVPENAPREGAAG
jgi:transglutaminase-like putative cysteine protease